MIFTTETCTSMSNTLISTSCNELLNAPQGDSDSDGATGSTSKRPKLHHSPTESSPTSASQSLQEAEEMAAASTLTAKLKPVSSTDEQAVVGTSEVDKSKEEGVAEAGEESGQLLASEDCIDAEELARDKACEDVREKVKRKFLVDMPEDFYQFWEFCKSLDPAHPDGKEASTDLAQPWHIVFVHHVSYLV